jgi:hypothetical protein
MNTGSTIPDALSKEVRERLAALDPKFADCCTTKHEQITRLKKARRPWPRDAVAALHRELNLQTAAYNETVKPLELAADKACDDYSDAVKKLLNTDQRRSPRHR